MRKIILGQDISILGNLDVSMPTITSSITAISFALLNFAERASFIQISDQKFTKSNYKFNQMERVKSPSKLYQTGNVSDLVKNRRGLAGKVTNFAHLTDPGVVPPVGVNALIWNEMLLDKWDEEDRKWEDIGF